jgi:hypothetical protein
MAVANHPRVELRGSDGAWTFVLTDPEGNDLAESVESYDTEQDANTAARLFEDSIRYALPLIVPLG